MDVKMPDGVILRGIPEGTPKDVIMAKYQGQAPAPQQPQAPSLGSRIGERIGERVGKVEDYARQSTNILNPVVTAGVVGGQLAGGVGDVLSETAASTFKAVVPEERRERLGNAFKSLMQTRVGQMGMFAMQKGGEVYQSFKESNPEAALVLESGANIAALTTGGVGAKTAGQKVGQQVSKITKSPARLDSAFKSVVSQGINKGIRPSVSGKRTFSQAKKFEDQATNAVSAIIENKKNLALTDDVGTAIKGKLPENLRDFSQSVEQTKRQLFRQWDDLAKKAKTQKAAVKLDSVVDELGKIADNKVLLDNAPEAAKYASDRMKAFANRVQYTTDEAQEAVKMMNQSLESFYKNPTYDAASKAYIDSLVANNIRRSLDDVITKATGPGYSELKKQYGALKALEKDINHRMVIDARKNRKGLIDFTDVLTGDRAIHGIMAANPASIGQAAGMKLIASFIKRLNDPNRTIKNMFKQADKIKSHPNYVQKVK